MTVTDYYQYYLQQLQSLYSLEEAGIVAGWVWEQRLGLNRMDILKNPRQLLTGGQQAMLETALQQLLSHQPVQYVTGETWFYNLKFMVNEQVLIPRPETEELVKWITDDEQKSNREISILDIGTGSGCIAVALKNQLPAAALTAVDISAGALTVATKNAAINQTNIDFIQADILDPEQWEQLGVFDIIVSNPPYIPAREKSSMDKNVIAFEPGTALFVPDDSPLLFYETIAGFAHTHLKPGGKIYLEVHQDHATETAAIFDAPGRQVEIKKDINGNERMVKITPFLKQ